MSIPTKHYVLWLDYSNEGWQPREFDDLTELITFVQNCISEPFVITELLTLTVTKGEPCEKPKTLTVPGI